MQNQILSNAELLAEEFIDLSSDVSLCRALKSHLSVDLGRKNNRTDELCNFHPDSINGEFSELSGWYVCYVNTNPIKIVTAIGSSSPEEIVNPLKKQLLKIQPSDFYDLLYIVTYFDPIGRYNQRDPFTVQPDNGTGLDLLLRDSWGNLAYNYQLENLYRMLTGCSYADAVTFRRDINKKKYGAWAETNVLFFPDGKPLSTIMQERMISDVFTYPNYAGAMALL